MITNMVARVIAPIPSEAFAFLSLNQIFFLETLLIFFSWVDGTKFPFGVLESGRLLESSFTCRRDMFTSHFPSRKTSKFLFWASNRILSRSGHFTHVPKRLPSSDNICSKILWNSLAEKDLKVWVTYHSDRLLGILEPFTVAPCKHLARYSQLH